MEKPRFAWKTMPVFVLLVVVGTATRVAFESIPNFAPVAAIALFAGFYFRSVGLAMSVPFLIMIASDWWIDRGGYAWPLMVTVYAALAFPVLLRGVLRRNLFGDGSQSRSVLTSSVTLFSCSLGSSLLFFFVTNFTAWWVMEFYEKSLSGLVHAYVRGLPFFRYTLTADLLFSAVLFGTFALCQMWNQCVDSAKQPALFAGDR